MLISDIVTQLRTVVPEYTSFFTQSTALSTVTEAASVVTVATTGVHGLTTGDFVKVQNILMRNTVSSLTQTGGIATLTTSSFHDVTFRTGVTQTVKIEGANQSEYNGEHTLLSVDTTNTLTFSVDGGAATPATGTIYLLEARIGYNDFVEIQSTPTTSTFTYTADANAQYTGTGEVSSASVHKDVRITGVVNIERAIEAYTEKAMDNMWAFISSDGIIANNERNHNNDSFYQKEDGQAYRQRLINNFSVYVFAPTHSTIAGRPQIDDMQEVRIAFFKALLGAKFDSGFNEGAKYGVTYLSDQFEDYNTAFYIHRFQFQTVENINRCDILENKNTVAWRTFEIDSYTDFDSFSEKIDVDGNLPEAE